MNTPKKYHAALLPLCERYGFLPPASIEGTGNGHYVALLLTLRTGGTVKVYGIPATTSTDIRHVAQNILKVARRAVETQQSTAAYRGGK